MEEGVDWLVQIKVSLQFQIASSTSGRVEEGNSPVFATFKVKWSGLENGNDAIVEEEEEFNDRD